MTTSIITSESFARRILEGTPPKIAKLDMALAYLQRSPTATVALQKLLSKIAIVIWLEDGPTGQEDQYFNEDLWFFTRPKESMTGKLRWNASLTVVAEDEGHNITGYQSPAVCFIHEVFHAIDPDLFAHRDEKIVEDDRTNLAEIYAMDHANIVAQELGEPKRYFHKFKRHPSRPRNAGKYLFVNDPTHFHIGTDLDISQSSRSFNEYALNVHEAVPEFSLSSIDEQHLKRPDSSNAQAISYYDNFLNRWKPEPGGKLVKAQSLIEQKPPALDPPPPKPPEPPKPPKPKPQPGEEFIALIEGVRAVHSWLTAPAQPQPKRAPAPPPPPPAPKPKPTGTAPPFDLQEIVPALGKMGMKADAKLLRKWFSNPLNYPLSAAAKELGIQQDRRLYPEWAIDTDTITMEAVLTRDFPKAAYEELLQFPVMFDNDAQHALLRIGNRYSRSRYIDSFRECAGNIQEIHRRFQFQRMPVVPYSKYGDMAWFGNRLDGLAKDNLLGALGNFSFYVAIAEAEVVTRQFVGNKFLEVHKVFIYVRSPFSFFDDDFDRGSQYLGHWNKSKMRLVPAAQPLYRGREDDYFDHAFRAEDGDFFHPVHYRDFRAWQHKHQQGGDMIVYSDLRSWRPPLLSIPLR